MLETKHISFSIGEKKLIDDVSVSFEAGKVNLIIGPNGAGKSTFIKLISNQLKASSGEILYSGKAIQDISISELAKFRAVLSQNIEVSFPLKVKEVVMMGRYPHFTGAPETKDWQACEEAMRFFDVWEMGERDYLTLSGGEKQRVQFARVVSQIWFPKIQQHRYLILDEPLTFLDVHYQFEFMHRLQELLKQKDLLVIGVVHDLNLAAKFADKLLLLHQGKVLATGSVEEVLSKEYIKTAYQLEPIIQMVNNARYIFFE